MRLLFSMDEQVHQFKVLGELFPSDLMLLKKSIFQFFESDPAFVILDLSEVHLQVPQSELQNAVIEMETLGNSKNIHFAVTQSDIEAGQARRNVLNSALSRQIAHLSSKIELREKVRRDIESLRTQNQTLRGDLERQAREMKESEQPRIFSPWIERLWSDR